MRALKQIGRFAGAVALVAGVGGCPPPPCDTFVDSSPLIHKQFETDGECATDPLCGMQVVSGTARRAQTFQAGEHGLEITAGSEVAQSMALVLPDPGPQDAGFLGGGPRQEYVRMIVRCDDGATIRFEELVSETLRGTPLSPPDSGVVRRDAGHDVVSASTDAAVSDGGESDAGEQDAAIIEDASALEDSAIADASIDSGVPPEQDAGAPESDAGFGPPPPPRLRIGTAAIPASSAWNRVTSTFITQNLAPASVESAHLVNLRIIVSGSGVCTIDNLQYGSIAAGICARGL